MESIVFKIIPHGGYEYNNAICLREDVLRKPLGLSFTSDELESEKDHIHMAGFLGNSLCATVFLVPQGAVLKMQQVAVRENIRGKGIASTMMQFCEDYALKNGFKEIYCHSRKTAVPFYLKNNYVPEGDYFEKVTLPHLKMRKMIRT